MFIEGEEFGEAKIQKLPLKFHNHFLNFLLLHHFSDRRLLCKCIVSKSSRVSAQCAIIERSIWLQFHVLIPDISSIACTGIFVAVCRDAWQEEHDHLLVLSRAVCGYHIHDTDPTKDVVLFFQSNRPVCTDIVDGAAGIHTAT